MLSCEEVTQFLSESLDHRLPFRKRLAVRIHYVFCKACPQFERQIWFMRDALHQFQNSIESVESFFTTPLSPEARERMQQALSRAADDLAADQE